MRLVRSFEFIVLIFLLTVAAAYWIRYAPLLPEHVPTHFGLGGQADGWSSIGRFAAVYWSVIGGLVVMFCGISIMILRIPKHLINLPRREYWLDPERQEDTRHDIARRLLGFCAVTLVFYLLVFHFSVRTALDGSARLSGAFNWVLGAYLAYTAIWTGVLLWRYSHAPREE